MATIFNKPARKRHAIPIINPNVTPNITASIPSTVINCSVDVLPTSSTPRTIDSLNNKLRQKVAGNLLPLETHHGSRSQSTVAIQETATNSDNEHSGSNSITTHSLDAFAPTYVPDWLRAVNQSTTYSQPCPSFPTINFAAYIADTVGPQFVRTVSRVSIPLPFECVVPDKPPDLHNYLEYWLKHLQMEIYLQHQHNQTFELYNHPLQRGKQKDELFTLHVPGLREHAPRLDLGDYIHVRLLQASSEPPTEHVRLWLQYGKQSGTVSPGFSGLSYDPQVHQIDRARDTVMLRIDKFPNSAKCNIMFPLQERNLEPLCRAIHTTSAGNNWLHHMLFPDTEHGKMQTTLSSASFDIPWIDQLNWEQKKAVHSVLSANYGSLPYLISGPPGTGKTKTLVELTLQLLRRPGHILLCAPSDTAADTLVLRLSCHLTPNELFRLNGWSRTFAEVPDKVLLYTFSTETYFSLPPVDRMLQFRVVVTTCKDADLLNQAHLDNIALDNLLNGVKNLISPGSPPHPIHWTGLLLDEAAQATEPEALIPLTVVMPLNGKSYPQFVAAGDEFQLGPKLLSRSRLKISLFERLFNSTPYHDHPLSRKYGTRAITQQMLPIMRQPFMNLVRNYRSHPAILSVPSSLFYNDTLITERSSSSEILDWPGWSSPKSWPVLFKQNSGPDRYESITDGDGTGSGALYNFDEAEIALDIAVSLLQYFNQDGHRKLEQKDVMVMSPFTAQVSVLRKVFRRSDLYEVNIGPLEAFQGLESRIVIICTTRTRTGVVPRSADYHVNIDKSRGLGIIDEPQRLNVAMTRAKEGLIVIGNIDCLISTGDLRWLEFIDFCRRNQCYDIPPHYQWPPLTGPHSQGRLERALIYAARGRLVAEQNQSLISRTIPKSGLQNGLKLMGARPEMDEEMWQYKELAQAGASEDIDLFSYKNAGDDTINFESISAGKARVSDQGLNNGLSGDLDTSDYDRNLSLELHDECTTQ